MLMLVQFLTETGLSLVVIRVFLILIVYLAIAKKWTEVREIAYKMMLLAERTFSEADGTIKYDFVVRIVYKYLPAWLKLFVSEDYLKASVQKWYSMAKDYLDDGSINHSVG